MNAEFGLEPKLLRTFPLAVVSPTLLRDQTVHIVSQYGLRVAASPRMVRDASNGEIQSYT